MEPPPKPVTSTLPLLDVIVASLAIDNPKLTPGIAAPVPVTVTVPFPPAEMTPLEFINIPALPAEEPTPPPVPVITTLAPPLLILDVDWVITTPALLLPEQGPPVPSKVSVPLVPPSISPPSWT